MHHPASPAAVPSPPSQRLSPSGNATPGPALPLELQWLWIALAPLVGLLYAFLVWFRASTPKDVLTTALFQVETGSVDLRVSLFAVVFFSYAWLLDGQHTMLTFARLSGEQARYGSVLRRSLLFFALGPVLLCAATALSSLAPSAGIVPSIGAVLVVSFQLWGLFHINRQHFGLYCLLKRQNSPNAIIGQAERRQIHLLLFLPLGFLLTHPELASLPGLPPSIAVLPTTAARASRLALALSLLVIAGTWARNRARERSLGSPHTILITNVVLVHLLVFTDLRLSLCMTPIIGVGHCLQYHFVVYQHGQKKHRDTSLFRSPWRFYGLALVASWLLYRGPATELLFSLLGHGNGLTLLGAMETPELLTFSQQLFGLFLMGWGAQHYFLDGLIWRPSRDPALARTWRPA